MKILNLQLGRKRQKLLQTESFPIEEVENIDIFSSSTDIEIQIHDKPMVSVVLYTYQGGPILKTESGNGVLQLKAKQLETSERSIFSYSSGTKLVVTAPEAAVRNWDIRTGSGDIDTAGLQFACIAIRVRSGDVTGRDLKGETMKILTGSGDIEMKHVNAGTLSFHASSGDIDLNYIKALSIEAKTSSGDIDLDEYTGDFSAISGSGSMKISKAMNGSVDLKTGSGDMKIAVDQQWGSAAVMMNTRSGKIAANLPIEITQQVKNKTIGTIGAGEGTIHAQSGSGDIMLYSK
ncbi:DUF4097 family beta strand repeat-containing protein [Oceanobacillus massiliensis]|uniref:DUF4097 family beta strand repeat-containing protein n=1 Tax=Oceanobacillus massiliensis TaxID=1465765 RepID=UPI000289C8FE|nr:DUF4097 family beta strand repeat-containing protein [Oceanobacillus massiliensis]